MGTPPKLEGLALDVVQQAYLGEALDHGPYLIFVADEDGCYLAVNQRACAILGYTRSELLQRRVTDVAVAEGARELYDEMLITGAASGVTPIRCRDGKLLPFRYEATRVKGGRIPWWVSVGAIDGTEPDRRDSGGGRVPMSWGWLRPEERP